jgi:hypothetical protein
MPKPSKESLLAELKTLTEELCTDEKYYPKCEAVKDYIERLDKVSKKHSRKTQTKK